MTKIKGNKGVYQCDQCGNKGTWNDDWQWYGSYFLMETAPYEVPYLCSDKCRERFDERMKKGEVKLPTLSNKHYFHTIKTNRKGY